MKISNLVIRSYDEKDLPLIYKSWLVSFRDSNHLESVIDKQIYFGNHKRIIAKILDKSTCLIAANPEDDNHILGYIVFDKHNGLKILHYIYVKAPYRRLGIANFLRKFAFTNESHPIVTSHYTRMSSILKDKWQLVFNPYILID